jgi:S1-C subfamily serine protease
MPLPDRHSADPMFRSSQHWLLHILLLLCLALCWRTRGFSRSLWQTSPSEPPPVIARGPLTGDEAETVRIYHDVAPSVVNIVNLSAPRDNMQIDEFAIRRGTGSGFVWNQSGYIVTNHHVLLGGDRFLVSFANRQGQFDGELVGIAPDQDLAVLKINAPAEFLKPAPLGTSDGLSPGQKVLAIGSPFELDRTLTVGVISGLGREIPSLTKRPILGVIQTDAAINPGSSGGPLLDSAGLVIGVNAQIRSSTGQNAGVGFAIPIDTVRRIVPQLIQSGRVDRVGMGIEILDDRFTAQWGLAGVMVRNVAPGSPAAQAGLLPMRRDESGRNLAGDLILAIDDTPIANSLDLFRALDQKQPGGKVQVQLQRGQKQLTVEVGLIVLQPE